MEYKLKLEMKFDAAHHLPGYKGECSRAHGHTWRVIVSIISKTLDRQHMVIDFKEIKKIVNQFDHQDVNEFIAHPTAENIAVYIYHKIDSHLKEQANLCATAARPIIECVTVFESEGASISVRGD